MQFLPFFIEYVYIVQVFEWQAMIFVIVTQKRRRVEEIMYDHSNPGHREKRSYRKGTDRRNNYIYKERQLMILFLLYFSAKFLINLFLIGMQIDCTNLIKTPDIYGYVNMWQSSFDFVLKLVTFLYLQCQMFYFHHFEFKRISKQLLVYFLLDMLSFLLTIFIYFLEQMDKVPNRFIMFCYITNVHHIILGYAILFLKDSKDCLQELSKLDYLLKISIFQRSAH